MSRICWPSAGVAASYERPANRLGWLRIVTGLGGITSSRALFVESVDAMENSVERHGPVLVGPLFGIGDRQGTGARSAGEIGFSIEDGKIIMSHLSRWSSTSNPRLTLLRANEPFLHGLREVPTDQGLRQFGCVEVRYPRIMNCRRCLPHFCDAWTVLRGKLRDILPR